MDNRTGESTGRPHGRPGGDRSAGSARSAGHGDPGAAAAGGRPVAARRQAGARGPGAQPVSQGHRPAGAGLVRRADNRAAVRAAARGAHGRAAGAATPAHRPALIALGLAAALGCGHGGPAPAAPVVGPAGGGRTAQKDAKGVVAEIYQTLGRGKTDSLFSLLSDHLVVFGPRKTDATANRSDALVALNAIVDAKGPRNKQRAQLRSGGVEVAVSQ